MAEIAGRALRAAIEPAVGDDAGADAGGDLDEQQMPDVPPALVELAQRHQIDVVVDEHRCVDVLVHEGRNVEAVPARHDRRVPRPSRRELDRSRHADTNSRNVFGAAPGRCQHR